MYAESLNSVFTYHYNSAHTSYITIREIVFIHNSCTEMTYVAETYKCKCYVTSANVTSD